MAYRRALTEQDHPTLVERAPRRPHAALPIAVAGSLALLLCGAPAAAAESARNDGERMPRPLAPLKALPHAALAPAAVAASAVPETYTVQSGDTISAIAAHHGLRTVDVLAINGLGWSTTIYPGQTIRLIGAIPEPVAPEAAAPEAAAPEPAPQPEPPASASAPLPAAGTHIVRSGDTISGIAAQYGVTTDAVLGANGLTRASIIYPDQVIAIPAAAVLAATPASATAVDVTLDAEQTANAQLIIGIGRGLGVPDRGIAIALGTAMQESWLRNLDWGDRDSLGLFQQRPSTGWGTEADVRDPVRATLAFFGGASDPNGDITRGLLDIPGWESLSFADAAQAVQVSAYPERYAQWEQPAHTWLATLG